MEDSDNGVDNEETEFQTVGGQSTSKKLSMQATTPPAEVPGYRLNQFLGAGAFGQVWVGRDLNTGRQVAVKFYLHRGGVNWSLLSREVKNLVQLSADRYVVQVLEVGWDADPPYYVMELIEGGSLEDLLRSRPRLPVAEAVEMFRKICTGLNRCHAKGVLHCDIKPANILLGDDSEPRLADFGQSRFSDDQSPALGTMFYMAPEQAELNATPDASWDVYSAGVIMYRMVTGSLPYRDRQLLESLDSAGSLKEKLHHYRSTIRLSPIPDEHLQSNDVDRPLARIISKCIAANPEHRYANVQQIQQDLLRRDATRLRRPLMLLGIVGPLLVLFATTVFGSRSIQYASEQALEALRKEATGSNQLAAAFAAQTLEAEIERYFQLSQDEASYPPFISQLKTTLQSETISQSLDEIVAMKTPANTLGDTVARQRLLAVEARQQLDVILADRLSRYSQSNNSQQPRLATMFVTDAKGTILSIAYNEPINKAENSAGKNFCYRTYFHGGSVDLPREKTEIGEVNPLTWTHLSAAFQSTATRLWKVAVSTPIYFSDASKTPDALFVMTINLGDFRLLQSKQGGNQLAVLVEAREGIAQGTILQHPLMDERRLGDKKRGSEKYQIKPQTMQLLLQGGDVDYEDPLSEANDGDSFAGTWIATMQPVAVPQRPTDWETGSDRGHTNSGGETDLLVMVQYRLAKVLEPVDQMRRALLWEGAAAIGSILAVTLTLWFLVRRTGNNSSRDRPKHPPKSATEIETLTLK